MNRRHLNEYEKDLLVKLLALQFKNIWFEDLEEVFERVRKQAARQGVDERLGKREEVLM